MFVSNGWQLFKDRSKIIRRGAGLKFTGRAVSRSKYYIWLWQEETNDGALRGGRSNKQVPSRSEYTRSVSLAD